MEGTLWGKIPKERLYTDALPDALNCSKLADLSLYNLFRHCHYPPSENNLQSHHYNYRNHKHIANNKYHTNNIYYANNFDNVRYERALERKTILLLARCFFYHRNDGQIDSPPQSLFCSTPYTRAYSFRLRCSQTHAHTRAHARTHARAYYIFTLRSRYSMHLLQPCI